jgi:1-acyl-sn-glycerol-3-phosphate acyltransferase
MRNIGAMATHAIAALLRVLKTMAMTFSLYFFTHLFVFVVLPLAIMVSYVDKDKIPAMKHWFVKILFSIVGKKLIVLGAANVNPDRSHVIVSNYPSFYAGFALIGAFPRASVVAHAFMKNVPLLGQMLARAGAIFVQPGRAGQGRKTIELHLNARDAAPSVIIFPEGKRTPDGKIHSFKRGFISFLRNTTHELLPVTLNGLYRLKPMKRFYLDPDAQPEMVIHAPLSVTTVNQMSDEELLAEAFRIIASVYRP